MMVSQIFSLGGGGGRGRGGDCCECDHRRGGHRFERFERFERFDRERGRGRDRELLDISIL